MYNFDLCVLLSAAFAGATWISLPTPHDMGCTTTPLGRASDRLEIGFKSSSAIAPTIRGSPLAKSYKSPIPDILSHRRLRQTKSYTLPRKKRKTTDNISRSFSVTSDFSTEKSSAMPLSPGGSPERNRKTVRFFVHRCMRLKVHSTRRPSRRRSLQTNS